MIPVSLHSCNVRMLTFNNLDTSLLLKKLSPPNDSLFSFASRLIPSSKHSKDWKNSFTGSLFPFINSILKYCFIGSLEHISHVNSCHNKKWKVYLSLRHNRYRAAWSPLQWNSGSSLSVSRRWLVWLARYLRHGAWREGISVCLDIS